MVQVDIEALHKHLMSVRATNRSQLANHFYFLPDLVQNPNLTCKFYLVQCEARSMRYDDLIDFALNKLVYYCLKRSEFYGTMKAEKHAAANRKARSMLVKKSSREIGELLLFLLLESEGIVQVLSKMRLKTDSNMYFHGADAVHIQAEKNLILHFGQSKLKSSFSSAVADSLSDIEEFRKSPGEMATEVNLISQYIDDSKFLEYTDTIAKIVNPYERHKENCDEASSILIGANFPFMIDANSKRRNQPLEEYLKKEYQAERSQILEKIHAKIQVHLALANEVFYFYIIPFEDVTSFVNLYSAKL